MCEAAGIEDAHLLLSNDNCFIANSKQGLHDIFERYLHRTEVVKTLASSVSACKCHAYISCIYPEHSSMRMTKLELCVIAKTKWCMHGFVPTLVFVRMCIMHVVNGVDVCNRIYAHK